MLTKGFFAFGKSLKKYGKRVLEWLKAICGEVKSSPRSRWHSRGQRFDPAYLHHLVLKTIGFQGFFFVKMVVLPLKCHFLKPPRYR